MVFRFTTWSKILSSAAISILICAGNVNAGWEEFADQQKAITVTKVLPKIPQEREKIIKEMASQLNIAVFDFSVSDLTDKDLEYLGNGLALRASKENKFSLKLLDLSNKYISREGIENLLRIFQNGVMINQVKQHPDVRETIMKVSSGVNVTDEVLEEWHKMAPSVFSGGLTILE